MDKTVKVDKVLDLRGLRCPNPGLITANKLESLAAGDILEVISNDRGARRSITALCRRVAYRLMEVREERGRIFFLIRKQ